MEIYFGDYKRTYWLGDRRRMTVKVSDIAGDSWEKDCNQSFKNAINCWDILTLRAKTISRQACRIT